MQSSNKAQTRVEVNKAREIAQNTLMPSVTLSSRLQNGAEDLLVDARFCLYSEHKVLI